MSRQVDIKALVSHIVRGDGADKCRICLGDTTEGQVYLGDTVMMDGERPVSLSELLETITGVEMEEDDVLPPGVCCKCWDSALGATQFRRLCIYSADEWTRAANNFTNIHEPSNDDKTYYIFYNEDVQSDTNELIELIETDEVLKQEKRKRPKKRRDKICKCKDCGKPFQHPKYLNLHLKGTKNRACLECGEVFYREDIPKHYIKSHNKEVLICEVCSTPFDDLPSIETHFEECHDSKTCVCAVCGHGFANARALRAHAYAHSLFHCKSCSKSFENRKCHKHHQKQCKSKSKRETFSEYICDYCGGVYDKKPSLRIHIIQKHLNVLPYICSKCGKRASTLAHLRSHITTHIPKRVLFKCYCGSQFRTELGYQLHQRIHTGERPYKCDSCGDCFLSASRRLDHIKRKHTKDMPHKCEKCGAKFVRPFELKKHYLAVHSTQVEVKPKVKQPRRVIC